MAAPRSLVVALALVALALAGTAAQNHYTTPVPILKHINRHNEDGSYSYGYENADGSYKIETKHTTGEVFGKYGYVDDTGKRREVEYGASRRGFEPAGTDINVAPPTLTNAYPSGPAGADDGQYREDPSVYYKDERYNNPRPAAPTGGHHRFQQPQQHYNPPQQRYDPPQQHYNPPQQQHYNPPQQRYHAPAPQHSGYVAPGDYNIFRGHPASRFDVHSGSYSVNY